MLFSEVQAINSLLHKHYNTLQDPLSLKFYNYWTVKLPLSHTSTRVKQKFLDIIIKVIDKLHQNSIVLLQLY